MPDSPRAVHKAWERAYQDGDIDGLMDLYEDGSLLVTEPGGDVARGADAVRGALEQFLSMGADFRIEKTETLDGDDLAIAYSSWKMTGGTGPDGNPLDLAFTTGDVLRRQPDGSWLFVLDNPWGQPAG
jgi:ketosteroid isomerase-like protein